MIMTTKVSAISLLLAFACSAAITATPPPDPTPHGPNLCDLDGGAYCTECGPVPDYKFQCSPQAAEGWLCCSTAGVCVAVATYDDCTGGVAGWCANYTTQTLKNGIEVAVCEDPA